VYLNLNEDYKMSIFINFYIFITMNLSREQKKLNKRSAAHFQRSTHIWLTKRCYMSFCKLQCFKYLGDTLLYTTFSSQLMSDI